MVIIITGATHTGKTRLAQKLLETLNIPYVSQDHIKMGLIRSRYTELTPADDAQMTDYLWPVTREMIKTVVENKQSIIIEGCYIPFDWENDFSEEYRKEIKYICLCLSREYIEKHFADIMINANCIEKRLDDSGCSKDLLIKENAAYLKGCTENGLNPIVIDTDYQEGIENSRRALGL